eukprot:4930881-Pleurochrysis_carterae.AAC.1
MEGDHSIDRNDCEAYALKLSRRLRLKVRVAATLSPILLLSNCRVGGRTRSDLADHRVSSGKIFGSNDGNGVHSCHQTHQQQFFRTTQKAWGDMR